MESSRIAGRMPEARIKSKLPIEIVVGRTNVITCLYATPDPRFTVGLVVGTNVGAGCSCHPTGANHLRSLSVPFHPVWRKPVARFRVPIWPTLSSLRTGVYDSLRTGADTS